MELISRDAVWKIIDDAYKTWKPNEINTRVRYCLDNISASIEDLPVIDEVPIIESRPKGKWIEHKNNLDTYYCSKCGTDALYYFGKPFGEYRVFQVESEFCPCCGADMRGKEE